MKGRKFKVLLMVLLMCSLVVIRAHLARAYVIDGLVDDWGIDLSLANSIGYFNANFPSGGFDIDVITDDKADSRGGWQYVGPGWTYGGNYFDAEALYFDNDSEYAYIAIIQGLPITGMGGLGNPWLLPGDIAIDADNDINTGYNGFEYGLNISDSQLYSVSSWKNSIYPEHFISDPWAIDTGTAINSVDFVYSGEQNTHYVLEAAIPLAYIGLSVGHGSPERNLRVHWTQECGNDYLTLNADVNPSTPEPSSLILLGTGLLGLIGTFLRKRFQETKRVFDIVASIVGIVITFPLMLILTGLIRLDSRGVILYKQIRVGENRREKRERRRKNLSNGVEHRKNYPRRRISTLGRLFTIYKLRTMKIDAEAKTGPVWAKEDDPRVTRLGRFLRKTHFDEIPQLINVLKGEMSLIGPRPERPKIMNSFNGDIPNYTRRLRVKPGITGLAQVRYKYDESLDDVKNKLRYDLLYIKKMCWTWDIRVLLLTIRKMLTGKLTR